MRYLLGFLATIGLIIIILILLLRGGGDSTPKSTALKLADYANSNSRATYIVDGPITSNEDHRQIEINVSAEEVAFTEYKGYEGEVIKHETFPNNKDAYTIFLKSLQQVGFTRGSSDASSRDERGHCPLGQRRIYSFENESKQLMRFWSTSCDDRTFEGSRGSTATLFRKQVPNYDTLARGTTISIF